MAVMAAEERKGSSLLGQSNRAEETSQGNLPRASQVGHQWQSQISHMGFSVVTQCFLSFEFHRIPRGQRKPTESEKAKKKSPR